MSCTVTRVVMAANGEVVGRAEEWLVRDASTADVTIGVDGGTRHFLRHELLPTIVCGDFDSLSPDELLHLRAQAVDVVSTPDQDATDLEKAIVLAIMRYPTCEITVYGATGGRVDHQHSVLSTLAKCGRTQKITLVDNLGYTFHAGKHTQLTDTIFVGQILSLITLGPVHEITTTGVEWPLNNESLVPGLRDGTLNRITAPIVNIHVGDGDLLVHLLHPPESVTVDFVDTGDRLADLIDVRWRVLRHNRPNSVAHFDIDLLATTRHIAAIDTHGSMVACATLAAAPDGSLQLRGMAVVPHQQGSGVGRKVLAFVHQLAKGSNKELWCNARLHAIPFYERNGWRAEGPVFQVRDVGPHRVMRFLGEID